ncbi:unnamed protein product [Tilletia controversa]|nr:unnamed protein product [Tilletia controversa]
MLAPYNNSMRLGQGFNSFTQSICVDNAVVIDPERAENVITNDGVTMRILAQKMKKASVWRQMKEYVNNGELATTSSEPNENERPTGDGVPGSNLFQSEYEGEEEEEEDRQAKLDREQAETDERLKQKYLSGKAERDAAAAAASRAATEPDTAPTLQSEDTTKDANQEQVSEGLKQEADLKAAADKKLSDGREADLEAEKEKNMNIVDPKLELMKAEQERNQRFKERGTGLGKRTGKRLAWSMQKSIGTSQIVTYSARFVDKLSEINDDMSGSAALSIKAESFGGSGSGAFINTEKFFDSDIRFYLSVKVINSSINFKDCLEYNPIRSVSEANADRFNTVFGDAFISGFLEGGELNACVMIKVLNQAKKKDIMAEAQVALTKGIELDGKGNIALARKNLQMNTETSINVRWRGGGSIKSYDEAWTIDSLTAAATRFPYLVSQFPQRIYALLTPYAKLRSFLKLKPAKLSPLKYENAALYANMLMDAFLEYKNLRQRVASDIRTVQDGVKRFKAETPVEGTQGQFLSESLKAAKLNKYEASLEGLDQARIEIRNQMNAIVREVDAITKKPEIATQPRPNVYVGPASFQTLIPVVEYKIRKIRGTPLSNELINKDVEVDKAIEAKNDAPQVHLFDQSQTTLPLSELEQIKVADLERDDPDLAEVTRVTPPVGSISTGTMFCTIDLGLQEPVITEISVGQAAGVLRALSITYSNGLTTNFGDDIDAYQPLAPDIKVAAEDAKVLYTLDHLNASEMITSAAIQVDAIGDEKTISVVGLSLTTNKGRYLSALSTVKRIKGHIKIHNFEKPITDGYISGFWGRENSFENAADGSSDGETTDSSSESGNEAEPVEAGTAESDAKPLSGLGITRLGLVWTQAVVRDTLFDEELAIECRTSSQLLTEDITHLDFGQKYPEPPQLIRGIRTLSLDSSVPTILDSSVNIGTERLVHTVENMASCSSASQWMILPELEDVHIQTGEVTIQTEGFECIETVPFELPFDEDSTPDVICWVIGFEGESGWVDLRVGINNGDVQTTSTSFELKVSNGAGSFDGSSTTKAPVKYKSVTVGWLAHTKITAPTESVFRSGSVQASIGPKGKDVATIKYETPFVSKPTKHFFALSAFRACESGEGKAWTTATKECTPSTLKLDIEAPPNSTFSGVWISSV